MKYWRRVCNILELRHYNDHFNFWRRQLKKSKNIFLSNDLAESSAAVDLVNSVWHWSHGCLKTFAEYVILSTFWRLVCEKINPDERFSNTQVKVLRIWWWICWKDIDVWGSKTDKIWIETWSWQSDRTSEFQESAISYADFSGVQCDDEIGVPRLARRYSREFQLLTNLEIRKKNLWITILIISQIRKKRWFRLWQICESGS
jgi:hypothetical protein